MFFFSFSFFFVGSFDCWVFLVPFSYSLTIFLVQKLKTKHQQIQKKKKEKKTIK
jgi:hypothetical protein